VTTAPLRLAASANELAGAFDRVRADLAVPTGFPVDVSDEADRAAANGPVLPPAVPAVARRDARNLELITIDPAGSRDLDQAFHAERQESGYRVHYAIADVAAFVVPDGAVDREAFVRGETLYLPDGRAPLYPDVLGEGAASLLPTVDRPALLWTFDLDGEANPVATRCERATVCSRAARSYADVQAELDRGDAAPSLTLLRELGEHLLDRERDRGGVSIAAPGQEVVRDAAGSYSLELEAPLPVETWNAQISLLTGREAARLMVEGGVGLVRTLPPPDAGIVARLRRTARALDIDWPAEVPYADAVRGLRPTTRARATFLLQALHALRGAGYAVVAPDSPPLAHAAVGAPYAHVTAPLRRLVDRFGTEVCLALCAGREPAGDLRAALPELPGLMTASDRRTRDVERAAIDAVEAWLLRGREGETFSAVVVDAEDGKGTVALDVLAVRGRCEGAGLTPGTRVRVRLDEADVASRSIRFSLESAE
jgi:exoribonuclease R